MSTETKLSLSRRQLLGASAGAVALSLLPVSLTAGAQTAGAESGLQSWLKRMSPETGPASSGSQRWIIRRLGGASALSVGLIYRACRQQPFELFRGASSDPHGGVSVAAEPGVIDGLAIQRLDSLDSACEICPFDSWLQPELRPGQYAILINSGRRRWRPDWSLVGWTADSGTLPMAGTSDPIWTDLTLLSLDVRPA